MKRFLLFLLAALAICSGCSKSELLSPREFTEEMAQVARRGSPNWKVEVVDDLQLKVTPGDQREGGTQFLENAYAEYKQNPDRQWEIMHRYAEAWRSSIATLEEPINRARIVPIVKDQPWLAEVQQSVAQRGTTNLADLVHEPLNDQLTILYVQDSPKHIRYLTARDLARTRLQSNQLRSLACTNLQRLLPEIKIEGGNGFYMITAGGNYETSLLLLDSVWKDPRIQVHGDIIVGIPSRDLVLVTGTAAPQLVTKLKEIVEKAYPAAPHKITPKLFVRRDGKWIEFKE